MCSSVSFFITIHVNMSGRLILEVLHPSTSSVPARNLLSDPPAPALGHSKKPTLSQEVVLFLLLWNVRINNLGSPSDAVRAGLLGTDGR